jgi:general secretion pathway protein J
MRGFNQPRRVRRARRRGDGATGFTLIELLVALSVLGLLGLVMFGELRFGTRAWDTAERVDTDAATVAAGAALLRAKLASAYPILTRGSDRERHVDFDGASDRLSFVGFLPERAGANITARLELAAVPTAAGDARRLVVRWRPELGVGTEGSEVVEAVLLERIAGLRLAYYGAERGQAAAWRDSWSTMKDLPLLVSVAVGFPDGDRRVWPELVVAPRVRADVTCAFDPLTRDCRAR